LPKKKTTTNSQKAQATFLNKRDYKQKVYKVNKMVSLLIPYRALSDHLDPDLDEFTYGDSKARAEKLKKKLKRGDFVFFHSTIRKRHFITAYFVVDRVLDTSQAASERAIADKYKNPHILEYLRGERRDEPDAVLFGDPILSKKLLHPLPFDQALAGKTSLGIPFYEELTENQCIGSATRQWRVLTEADVETIREEIRKYEAKSFATDLMLSTDEIQEIREIDLENFLVEKSRILGPELILKGRQIVTPTGRIDLLYEDVTADNIVIVELKLGYIGKDTIAQLRGYMHELKAETEKGVKGIIVCQGVLPTFQEQLNDLKNIKILRYGWKLCVNSLDE